MTNEEIVLCVRKGAESKDFMQMLFDNNLPAIKAICRKYTPYGEMDDLLQEAYFGLWEAVLHYDSCNEVKFMTYASWWVRQAVIRYIEKNGSCLYIPINVQESILKYKRCVSNYEKNNGRTPSEKEIADIMKISVDRVRKLERLSQPIISIDAPLEDGESCLSDTVAGMNDTENEVVENIHGSHIKNELWRIVDDTVDDVEKVIIKEHFINRKSISRIAEDLGLSANKVRTMKEQALIKMRRVRVKRELSDLEVYESRMYHTGIRPFKVSHTSAVESIVMQRSCIEV